VFEDIALSCPPGADTSPTSIRAVSAHLGVSKDTALRAFAVLRRLGAIEATPPSRSSSGRFGPTAYRVHLPEGVSVVQRAAEVSPDHDPRAVRTGSGHRGRRSAPVEPRAVPTLFDLA
jgi:DNA-binding transcriptional MocR family regulator